VSAKEASDLSFVMKALYCSYGAKSKAQFSACVHHVSIEHVLESQTQAGEYGRGELKTCGSESAPNCPKIRRTIELQVIH
jgi:hypothetical protein